MDPPVSEPKDAVHNPSASYRTPRGAPGTFS